MKILIICHRFPPYPGIGGRRWLKFAKQLAAQGHSISIISKEKPSYLSNSQWNAELESFPAARYYFKGTLDWFSVPSKVELFTKVKYKLRGLLLKALYKGDFADSAIDAESSFTRAFQQAVTEQNPDVAVVTGAPFRLCYFTVKLAAAKLPTVVDLRDPWTRFNEDWSLSKLSKKRCAEELEFCRQTIPNATVLTSVHQFVLRYYLKKYPTIRPHGYWLPNVLDTEEFEATVPAAKAIKAQDAEKMQLVYSGTFYNKMEHCLTPFFKVLETFDGASKLSFELVGNVDLNYYQAFQKSFQRHFTLHGFVKKSKAHALLAGADFGLIFLMRQYESAVSTKLLDSLAMGKKVVVIGYPGLVSALVEKYNAGVFIDTRSEQSVQLGLTRLLEYRFSQEYKQESNFPLERYHLQEQGRKLEQVLLAAQRISSQH